MDNSKPAFPLIYWDRTSTGEIAPRDFVTGMSLREYYAGKAMEGLLSKEFTWDLEEVAKCSVQYADALLKALEG